MAREQAAEGRPEAQVILDPKDRAAKGPPEAQVILDPKDRANRDPPEAQVVLEPADLVHLLSNKVRRAWGSLKERGVPGGPGRAAVVRGRVEKGAGTPWRGPGWTLSFPADSECQSLVDLLLLHSRAQGPPVREGGSLENAPGPRWSAGGQRGPRGPVVAVKN